MYIPYPVPFPFAKAAHFVSLLGYERSLPVGGTDVWHSPHALLSLYIYIHTYNLYVHPFFRRRTSSRYWVSSGRSRWAARTSGTRRTRCSLSLYIYIYIYMYISCMYMYIP